MRHGRKTTPISGRQYIVDRSLNGFDREERRGLRFTALSTWSVGVGGTVMLFSDSGPGSQANITINAIINLTSFVVGAFWLRGPWPGAKMSLVFCIYADVSIGGALILWDDPLVALVGAIWFGLVSEYISLTETGTVLKAHSIAVAGFTFFLGWRSAVEPGADIAVTIYVLLAVLAVACATPLIRYITSNALRENTLAAESLARRDALTGLPNRRGLQAAFTQQVFADEIEPESLLIAVIDLDRFKAMNDSYGHEHGDEVLRRVARRLQATVRSGDCVARVGGEEFVVVAAAQRSSLTALVHRLLEAIAHDVENYSITGSLGAVMVQRADLRGRDPTESVQILLAGADQAMYRAKRRGGNQAVLEQGALGETG